MSAKLMREMALVGESATGRHMRQGLVGVNEVVTGNPQPQISQVFLRSEMEGTVELAFKGSHGHVRQAGKPLIADARTEVISHVR